MTELQRLIKTSQEYKELEKEAQSLEGKLENQIREVGYLTRRVEELEDRFPCVTGWDEEKLELLREHWDKITVEDVRAITEPV